MLTPSQQQALRLDRHLCVTANAGSGKTLVLVERYLEIVSREEASVADVVAITFTDKAASELKRKIAEGVTRRLADPDLRSQHAALERAREQLPSAVIHTIHGFCSRILHEYPVEAGVDASFSVVEPIDQETLLQESFQEVYRSILKEGEDPALKDRLLALLQRMGKRPLVRIVETLGKKRELAERLTAPGGLYDRPDDELLGRWQEILGAQLQNAMNDPALRSGLAAVLAQAKGKPAEEMRTELGRFDHATDPVSRAGSLSTIFSTILTAKGEVSKKFLGKGVELPDCRMLAEYAQRLGPLLAAVTDARTPALHGELLRSIRVLLSIYRLAMLRYEEKKTAGGQLDFDDLQLKTRELLKKETVRMRLASRYRYIMVDEYQDTNRLQYEILQPLVDELRSGNLFIVGDPKQSIYGFRNADVAVFEETRRDVRRAAGESADVVLGESFRLLGSIAAFTNTVFRPVMGTVHEAAPGFDVPYDDIVLARRNGSPGRVEFMEIPDDGDSTMTEGEAIARRIRQLHGERYQVFDRDEQAHDLRFRDIAILLRSRKNLGEIEQALVLHRIPYVVSGGAGYFQTQTIYDFYNYFRFILNRHDDVALAGILRSPFFSVSDAELFQAAGASRTTSLWDHLLERHTRSGFPALTRALKMLADDLEAGPRMTVPELIDRIVEHTAIEAVSEAVPRGDQSIANLRKLETIARMHDSRGFTTLYDFTVRLKRLVEEEEKEGQAVIDVQRDAVQVLTVHAAKGLEFPVAIVPSLERTFRADNQPFLDEHLGIGFLDRKKEDGPAAPLVEYLRQQARARSVAEEKRIFYVACTRARDCLILSAKGGGRGSGPSWLKWLSEQLPVGGTPDLPVIDIPSALLVLTRSGESQEVTEQPFALRVHIMRPGDLADLPGIGPEGGTVALPTRIAVEPVLRPPRGEIFSASKIRTYMECPALYYLRYVLGMPDATAGHPHAGEGDDDNDVPIDAGTRGTIIHEALERIDGRESPEEVRRIVRELAASHGGTGNEEISDLAQLVVSVAGSGFWRHMQRGSSTQTEYSLTAAIDGDYITGTIDRLFCDEDDTWHLVDFKTEQIRDASFDRQAAAYLPQLKLYALLVSRLHETGNVRATLLFTSRVEKPRTWLFSSSDLKQFEEEIRGVLAHINSFDFKPLQSPCPRCPHQPEGCQNIHRRQ